MNIIEIINKKRENKVLNSDEIKYCINGYLKNEIKDYQMSALLMAICINGMNQSEIFELTDCMINSGEILDLSSIDGVNVDKHSTGGVGDKVSLIVAPLVASCGLIVPMMSGRGLGHTGGTLDKLESIPGFNVNLTKEEYFKQLNDIGIAIVSPTEKVAPADKKLYALRDVTGTVASSALGASSIMSKKIASGVDKIVLDVKVGKGSFYKNLEDATKFAKILVNVGKHYNKETIAILTNMNNPLGDFVGNGLEVTEACSILGGVGNKKLFDLCVVIASYMVSLGKNVSFEEAKKEVMYNFDKGYAQGLLLDMISYQGGNFLTTKVSQNKIKVKSLYEGYIHDIDALKIGFLSMQLGGGRMNKDDIIDHSVGIKLHKNVGDYVKKEDVIAYLYVNNDNYDIKDIYEAYTISKEIYIEEPMIYKIIK